MDGGHQPIVPKIAAFTQKTLQKQACNALEKYDKYFLPSDCRPCIGQLIYSLAIVLPFNRLPFLDDLFLARLRPPAYLAEQHALTQSN
ncbi:hypothetical protein [Lacipirellula parvula]|uniref:Uncharacterized protein n=1 Tax=Lacipirellula parvula TaxID=2650471 RepID=A0A5K7XH65_9BACT|nr:hypothetical protein [Lacipirellula parvula]BBO36244.1 hypothetical protein PLANPX_5856 [Lacipirellula parvula]